MRVTKKWDSHDCKIRKKVDYFHSRDLYGYFFWSVKVFIGSGWRMCTEDKNKQSILHYGIWTPLKDRNGMDLTEAEDINKRWQEYTE